MLIVLIIGPNNLISTDRLIFVMILSVTAQKKSFSCNNL